MEDHKKEAESSTELEVDDVRDSGAEYVESKGACMMVRHVQVALMCGAVTIAYALRVNMSVAVVVMASHNASNTDIRDFGWTTSETSTILSSFFWGYVVTQVPGGQLAERFGGKRFIAGSICLTGFFTALTPLAADIGGWQLVCASRLVQGLCQGCIYPSVHALLARWVPPDENGRSATIVYAGSQLGTVIAMPASGLLANSNMGWPSIFYVFGGVAVAWSLLYFILGADTPAKHKYISRVERIYIEKSLAQTAHGKEKLPTPWKAIFTSPPMISLIIAHCTQNWGFWTLLTQMPTYMDRVLGFNIQSNSLLSALPYLVMWGLSFVFSGVSYVLERKKCLSLGTLRKLFNSIAHWGPGIALVVLSYTHVSDPTAAVVLLTVAVGINAGVYVGYQINHIDLSPNFAGTMMGITNCAANIMSIIGPLMVGLFVKNDTQEEWRYIFLMAAGIYFLGNLTFVIFGKAEVQPWNDPSFMKKKHEDDVIVETEKL
ncbi:putative inorganic phosphate cotransporter [Schistocerca gregaria]|uniref:putative inorganic phosphate cotransporter n=1 Tax=Schistocerca gregaria TaxID=7010 RepID=UPI00211F1F52|nr:putative inorganic phosphate cotransporter [Schistocerca gregaria]